MILFFQPLIHEDNDEHSSHDKADAFCINGEQRTDDAIESCRSDPVFHYIYPAWKVRRIDVLPGAEVP